MADSADCSDADGMAEDRGFRKAVPVSISASSSALKLETLFLPLITLMAGVAVNETLYDLSLEVCRPDING